MKNYCMSSFLTFRFIEDENINFYPNLHHTVYKPRKNTVKCRNVDDIDALITNVIQEEFIPGKTALFLSGGIDSAILASYLPKGSKAYTFKCIADGAIDESTVAGKYAEKYDLDHEIVEIFWEDYIKLTPEILAYNNVPVHSIEIQLYKAAMLAQKAGIEKIIVGESADLIFGGMDKLLSKDWDFDDFVKRYTFVSPESILKEPVAMSHIYERYREGKKINFLKFMDEIFSIESSTSYMHAFNFAQMDYVDPYSYASLAEPLDLRRIRNGEPKYLIRELFERKYPELAIPDKIPMPRPMGQWLKDWEGPRRKEFKPSDINVFTGDQKWLIYCLEIYLDIFENMEILCEKGV